MLNGEVTGAVVPTANFEPLAWVLEFEKLSIALGHVSLNSVSRMLHLVDPHMTGLSRFLAPDEKSISYGTIQKTFSALNSEIQALVLPASLDYIAVAGGIEDHATNAPLIIRRVLQILDNLFYLAAIELMHAAQAVDLRKKFEPSLMIGESTGTLLREFRKSVPFLDEDRVLSHDVEAAYRFLKASKTIQPSASLDSGSSINKHFTAGL